MRRPVAGRLEQVLSPVTGHDTRLPTVIGGLRAWPEAALYAVLTVHMPWEPEHEPCCWGL